MIELCNIGISVIVVRYLDVKFWILFIQVLTSKSCSEEGLEDATNLLVQLSWANNATRSSILKLLLEGARELGLTVCSHIK